MKKLREIILGPALPDAAAHDEKLPIPIGLAVLSSDVLSSCAYATDELLAVLVLAGVTALKWSVPLCLIIIALLSVLVISYRQLIRAYPSGGGAYTVAKENLGKTAGLIAASGLLIDYVLTASVSIAAGVDAIVSAFPSIAPEKIGIGLVLLMILLIGNLRGVRESGRLFAVPTLLFVVALLVLIIAGMVKFSFGHPVIVPPVINASKITESIGLFFLLRAFSSGCTALTGTEAISNAVLVFRKPEVENARKTMLFMGIILGILFFGVTFLAKIYSIVPVAGETIISQLGHTVFGQNLMYFFVQFATLAILIIAANTSFADFPRVASMLGRDGYLPNRLADVGRRLVYSNGMLVLGGLSGAIYIVFRGDVAALIPLYAVGVFISFTLSQTGMVRHWLRTRQQGWLKAAIINGTGAFFTSLALIVIVLTKFTHGAWIIMLLIPVYLYMFSRIHNHYQDLAGKLALKEIKNVAGYNIPPKHKLIVFIPNRVDEIALTIKYSKTLSNQATYVFLNLEGSEEHNEVSYKWSVIAPKTPLTVLTALPKQAPAVIQKYLHEINEDHSEMTVVMPEEPVSGTAWDRWWQNQKTSAIKAAFVRARIPVLSIILDYIPENLPQPEAAKQQQKNDKLLVLVPGIQRGVFQAVHHAGLLSRDVSAIYVDCEGHEKAEILEKQWPAFLPAVPLVILPSIYRNLVEPVSEYIREIKKGGEHTVTIMIPEMLTGMPFGRILHRNAAAKLKKVLLFEEHVPVLNYYYRPRKRHVRVIDPQVARNRRSL